MIEENSSPTHPLDIYFQHNLWSNLRLIDACSSLDEEQLAFTIEGTFGSIHSTLGHIVFAEERYIYHITSGEEMADAVRPTPDTSLAELRARAVASGETLLRLAASLEGSRRVNVGSSEEAYLITVEALLLQAIHHGSEHRTQIETILGHLGLEPPGLSGWRYFEEQSEG